MLLRNVRRREWGRAPDGLTISDGSRHGFVRESFSGGTEEQDGGMAPHRCAAGFQPHGPCGPGLLRASLVAAKRAGPVALEQ